MGQAQQTRRAVLIVEDDAELRSLTVALLEDEQLDTIECESANSIRRMGHRHGCMPHTCQVGDRVRSVRGYLSFWL